MDKTQLILSLADPKATVETTGGKGASLARLAQASLPVPGGFHITTDAYWQFIQENNLQTQIMAILTEADPDQPATLETASQQIGSLFQKARITTDIAGAIAQTYASLPGQEPPVAVRSSATAEDLPDLSFAGQQDTFLNIQGVQHVLEAVKRCWASLWTGRAIGYRIRNNIDQSSVSLAVVVQVLVPAEAAGILFTANPVNNRRDQVVISAAWGLGEAVVSGSVTPDHLVIAKGSWQIVERQTAEKQVMTVRTNGATETRSVPDDLKQAPVLSDKNAVELAQLGVRIEDLYQTPVDIEWAILDGKIYILQARPVTTLGKTKAQTPGQVTWKGPKPHARYLRNNIVELMPDPLTPLFGTLGRRIINHEMKRPMTAFMGRSDLVPEELIITINDYAYYNGDLSAKQILLILLSSVGIMRRMFSGMEERWEAAQPRYKNTVANWQSQPIIKLPSKELLAGVSEMMGAAIDYYTAIVSGLIPAAWISEALFTGVYNLLIKRRSDPRAAVYLLGFDSTPLNGEKELFDLAQWTRGSRLLTSFLLETPTNELVRRYKEDEAPSGLPIEIWVDWHQRVKTHLLQYGATIYDLDFAKPTPLDEPGPLFESYKMFLKGVGSNPYERQQASVNEREKATSLIRKRLKGFRLSLFNKYLARAQHLAPLREEALAGIGTGYPQMRQMLEEIGRRLAMDGAIEKAADIFWLNNDELEKAAIGLDKGEKVQQLKAAVRERKTDWKAKKALTPPFALPQRSRIGKARKSKRSQTGLDVIKGVACSPGRVTGRACVLSGPEDFPQMQPGDILVAAITTPAWTPLFTMASAIVTDVGGPLSHGSIVAREYGIPAVLGTGDATGRIQSGNQITVDGTEGKVYLGHSTGREKSVWDLDNPKDKYMRASICELMPNPVTPLFATLGMDAISRGISQMARDLFQLPTDTLGNFMQTINGYVYQKVSFTGRQWWLLLSRMGPAMPRVLKEGVQYWKNAGHPRYQETTAHWQAKDPARLSPQALYSGVQEILDAFGQHLGSLMASTMGPSAGSEGLFTQVYQKFVQRPSDPGAQTFLMGFDNQSIEGEKHLYDLAQWCRGMPELAAYLTSITSEQLADCWNASDAPENIPFETWQEWRSRFTSYLQKFGYGIYNMDFASPLPKDQPSPILETLVIFMLGQAKNPYERQAALIRQREQAIELVRPRLHGLKLWAFNKTLHWAQSLAPMRENGIAEIGLGYPVLRDYLHEIGLRFTAAGALTQPDDIYWLKQVEMKKGIDALEDGRELPDLREKVIERKDLWKERKRLIPPPQLPPKMKYLGLDTEKIMAMHTDQEENGIIHGTPCSPGSVTGTARVLHGPEDFIQMQPGDILVAGITTPAWTPLFAIASAVVTDIGGPLSHGSIVAREYGIPAVLGTGVATARIASGQSIHVDGSQGTIQLLDH